MGKRCPAYDFANSCDYVYGRFMFDARSRSAVMERIGKIDDVLLKTMLWGALWDSVREAELNPNEFIALALKTLPMENDEELTQTLLGRTGTAFQRYLSSKQQAAVAPQLESLYFDRMTKATELGLRITYFRAFRNLTTTAQARQQLKDILAGKLAIPGVEIKPLDRWQIIRVLLANSDAEAMDLLEAERLRDKSDDAKKQDAARRAARRRIVAALPAPAGELAHLPPTTLSASLARAAVADGSGDTLDAALCAVQAAFGWRERRRGWGLPRDVDPLEGWIVGVPRS